MQDRVTGRQDRPRVVITGMGALTPVGLTAEDTWKGLLEGRSGIVRTHIHRSPSRPHGVQSGFSVSMAVAVQMEEAAMRAVPEGGWKVIKDGPRAAQLHLPPPGDLAKCP